MEAELYLNSALNKNMKVLPHNEMITFCENIIDQKDVGLDKYSKEMLALVLEKLIMVTVDNHFSKTNSNPIKNMKMKEPLYISNSSLLKRYIRIFLLKRKEYVKTDNVKKLERFYDEEIENRSKKISNKMITLPGGNKLSIKDLTISITNIFNEKEKKEFVVKSTSKKSLQARKIGVLVGALSVALVVSLSDVSEKKVEKDKIETEFDQGSLDDSVVEKNNKKKNYFEINDLKKEVIDIKKNNQISLSENIKFDKMLPKITIESFKIEHCKNDITRYYGKKGIEISNDSKIATQYLIDLYKYCDVDLSNFEGYSIEEIHDTESKIDDTFKALPIDEDLFMLKQKFLYYICQKENVDFNDAMCIWTVESGGNFNCNTCVNSTHDYGEMQINRINLKDIEGIFGFTVDDIQNDWLKNMIASVYIMKNNIEFYNLTDTENFFGYYNGNDKKKEKSVSRDYVEKTMTRKNMLYNKRFGKGEKRGN